MNEHQLAVQANEIRESIIEMLLAAGSGHTAGPLGMTDIFTALFFVYPTQQQRLRCHARCKTLIYFMHWLVGV